MLPVIVHQEPSAAKKDKAAPLCETPMATKTTTTNYYGDKDTYFTSNDGLCASHTKVRIVTGQDQITEIEPEHRVKPVDLTSYGAMTTRGVQYTKKTTYGRMARVTKNYSALNPCGPGTSKVGTLRVEDSLAGAVMPPGFTFPSSTNWEQAIRNKIASEQVSFAENIGEWRESVKMLSGAGGIMRKAYRAARQLWHAKSSRKRMTGNIKQILGKDWKPKTPWEWGDVVSCHLAITYGIRPLLGQLEDVLDQLDKVRMPRKRIQVTIPMECGTQRHTFPGYVGEVIVEGRMSQRAVFFVQFKQDAADFTAGNIASSIWAGTKLSFMVDWSLNIGGYLESLTALTSVSAAWGTVTTKRESRGVSTCVPSGSILLSPGIRTYVDTSRARFNSIPLPARVDFRFGQDPGGNGWDQLLSSMEILHQLRRGKWFFGD